MLCASVALLFVLVIIQGAAGGMAQGIWVMAGNRDYFTVDDLVNHIDACADRLEIKQKATVEPTKLRTQSLHRLNFLGAPFGWQAALVPGAIINIDCRGLLIGMYRFGMVKSFPLSAL